MTNDKLLGRSESPFVIAYRRHILNVMHVPAVKRSCEKKFSRNCVTKIHGGSVLSVMNLHRIPPNLSLF